MARPKHQRSIGGFTLIELMVTVAIAAILLTVGVPSFREFIANQRAKTAAQALFTDLTFARSEAIKRNGSVVVTPVGGKWADGWTISSAGTDIRKQSSLPQISATSPAASITFQRTGRVDGASGPSVTFCDAAQSDSVTERIIGVDLSGLPRITLGGSC